MAPPSYRARSLPVAWPGPGPAARGCASPGRKGRPSRFPSSLPARSSPGQGRARTMTRFGQRRTAPSARPMRSASVISAGIAALSLAVAACSSSTSTGAASVATSGSTAAGSATPQAGTSGLTVPTANLPVLQSVGKGEGQLNLIAWEGYLDPSWVKPFEQQTGCVVNAKYAGSSDEMVSLMKNGGGGQYDMVSSSGDADLRILYAGDAHPVNMNLIPSWKQFFPAFKSPPFNTINGVHYGVSLQWGPNVLMYNTKDFKTAPPSWSVIYNPKYKGQVTIPDNPIQIADAALYLSKHKP